MCELYSEIVYLLYFPSSVHNNGPNKIIIYYHESSINHVSDCIYLMISSIMLL